MSLQDLATDSFTHYLVWFPVNELQAYRWWMLCFKEWWSTWSSGSFTVYSQKFI